MLPVSNRSNTDSSLRLLRHRGVAAYLGLAVGDALGATVEFMSPREIQANIGVHRDITGGGWLRLPAGVVTDDTTMSLALGDALLEMQGIDAHCIASHFDQWMRDKPVDIGNTVRRGLLHFRKTGSCSVPLNEYDAGNGACMRVLPIALATFCLTEDEIRHAVNIQSHITHNNPLSDAATLCVVKLVHMGLSGLDKGDMLYGPLRELTSAYAKFSFRRKRMSNPSAYIVDTMQAVIQAFMDTDDFESCLVDVVNRGGDADTTGAIAGMIAGAYYGESAIPERWLKKLDKNTMQRCREQAVALIDLCSTLSLH